jgi:hypothetical protein
MCVKEANESEGLAEVSKGEIGGENQDARTILGKVHRKLGYWVNLPRGKGPATLTLAHFRNHGNHPDGC